MQKRQLEITKTARYFTIGELNDKTKEIWIVCHGYGQLGNYFVRNFNALDDGKTVIIAPEGLHRFYLNGFNGRVGASWMTKIDRETDIKDYINFLDSLYSNLLNQISNKVKIVVLGFSQGGATVSRWIKERKPKIDQLILWATVFPDDMNWEENIGVINQLNTVFVVGDKDEFISEENLQQHIKKLESHKVKYNLVRFKGTHKIEEKTLLEIWKSV